MDLIDRFKKWKLTHSNESDSDSENEPDELNISDDSEWNMTVKVSSISLLDVNNISHNEIEPRVEPLDTFNSENEIMPSNVKHQTILSAHQQLYQGTKTLQKMQVVSQSGIGGSNEPLSSRSPTKDQKLALSSNLIMDYKNNSGTSLAKEKAIVKELLQQQHQSRSCSPQKSSSPPKKSKKQSFAQSGGMTKSDLNIVSK